MDNKRVIIVCHKNTLRGIFKILQNLGDKEVKRYQIPNALPVVLEFDEDMKYLNNYCLMDKEAHSVRAVDASHSYNNIDWAAIKNEGTFDKTGRKFRPKKLGKIKQIYPGENSET